MKLNDFSYLIMYCIFMLLIIFIIDELVYLPIMDRSDNIFHLVNQKGIQTGVNPFWGITNYPKLFYYIPIHIITIEFIVSFFILPISLFKFSGLFITPQESHVKIYAPLIWVASGFSFLATHYFGQVISMVLFTFAIYFWIKKSYLKSFLCNLIIFLGHNGTTAMVFAFIPFYIIQTYLNNHNVKWDKTILKKNGLSYTIIMLTLLPSIIINTRGWIPISFFGSIFVSVVLKHKKDIVIPALMISGIFTNIIFITKDYIQNERYNQKFDDLLSAHYHEDAYCFYPNIKYDETSSGQSRITMRGWYYRNVPVKPCSNDIFINNTMKAFSVDVEHEKADVIEFMNDIIYGEQI